MKNIAASDAVKKTVTLFYIPDLENGVTEIKTTSYWVEIRIIGENLSQEEYRKILSTVDSELVMLFDGRRMPLSYVGDILQNYASGNEETVGYYSSLKKKTPSGMIRNQWSADREITGSPFLIGPKSEFLRAYAGCELSGQIMAAAGYSLQKNPDVKFTGIEVKTWQSKTSPQEKHKKLFWNYSLGIPAKLLFSGHFLKNLWQPDGKTERNMVFRMLMFLFVCFAFVYMPYISRDYGISGDEFVDQRHSGYVIDYFTKGDSAALYQPKTALHLYGIGVQVIAEAVCRTFNVDDIYAVRHAMNGVVGALGVLMTGLLALRWGGGLCGLLAVLMMFFTPRYFGHSMNNLKDLPFAVGYIMSVFYFIRLFDYYPYFKLRHILGVVVGLLLALGTRSGGLMLFPCFVMYAGFFYIRKTGIREFYKFGRYRQDIGRILNILFIVIVAGYLVSILLWPYALERPFTGVMQSLKQFTNYNISLRTIFEGKQMMSSMLPWNYAPKYLLIGVPLVSVLGFLGYWIYVIVRRKEFSLISYFLLFVAVFPVFWVIYKNSNLYGGIRHLLFVMPVMVVVAARFWVLLIRSRVKAVRVIAVVAWIGLFTLPVIHTVKNHPNDYVYFNEVAGGLKKAYGDYETDYYYNSLKNSADWLKKNIRKNKDEKIIIATNHLDILRYYFRNDPNVRVIYSRYYEKYAKDWDYAIFANVYINRFQLKNKLFPPKGVIYSCDVDGFPMSVVIKRESKQDFEGIQLEQNKKIQEALTVLTDYIRKYPDNEEVLSHMAKQYYMINDLERAEACAQLSLKLHPSLSETLYILSLVYIVQNRYNDALETAQRILDENSLSADGYYLKALVNSKMKNDKEAINLLNKALSYRPNYEAALGLAGEIMLKNGNNKVAAEIYQKLVNSSKNIRYITALADCYCRMQDYQKMDKLLEQINQMQPAYFPAYKVLLRKFIQQKDMAQALTLLKILEDVQSDAELFVLRAMYEKLKNNVEGMRLAVDKALQLDPNDNEALGLKKSLGGNVKMKREG